MRSGQKPLVLVVDDEVAVMTLITYNLQKSGFRTLPAYDGEAALVAAREHELDLILLDWMLPGITGIDTCRELRRNKATRHIPLIMLTARGEEADRVEGLDAGADDYVAKPFSVRELTARARAVLRRAPPRLADEVLRYRDITLDIGLHKVRRGDRTLHLGPTEFRLLRHFLQHAGRVFSREQLLDAVWGRDVHVEPRTVDVHIRRLRKSLNEGDAPDLIRTVRSAGYAMDAAPRQAPDTPDRTFADG